MTDLQTALRHEHFKIVSQKYMPEGWMGLVSDRELIVRRADGSMFTVPLPTLEELRVELTEDSWARECADLRARARFQFFTLFSGNLK